MEEPYDLKTGWYVADLQKAAEDDERPKLLQNDYEDRADMIDDERVVNFREWLYKNWESNKKYAILLDCSTVKPYSNSPTHMKVIQEIRRYNLGHVVQQYTMSEPIGVVPREHETKYPCYAYNLILRPHHSGYDRMIEVFKEGVDFIKPMHDFFITFMPSNKLHMIKKAINFKTIDIPWGLYEQPPIKSIVDEVEEKGRCSMFEYAKGWDYTGTD
ncbi:MAG: DUF5591 domain-containing protein [Petrotogales bacterium]